MIPYNHIKRAATTIRSHNSRRRIEGRVAFASPSRSAVLDSQKKKVEEDMVHVLDILMVFAIVAVLLAQTFFPPR